ncbi:MAG: methylenetetrahydrofolate reductase [Gammaproteobacteria bacterium]|nr:methylenetetrahydrofolate reductase [Gammaproteobacteria bacterium]
MERSDLSHLSFEFFPPKTPRETRNLLRTANRLAEFHPDFYSVTHGAGGSAREGTLETVSMLREHGYNAIPHITWGGDTRESMVSLLARYADIGVSDMVVLRGDVGEDTLGEISFRHAHELVSLIREEMGNRFRLHVGCYPEMHPEAESIDVDIDRLKEKVDAGADCCITQYFFNPDAYPAFLDNCRQAGIRKPILPGVMPIANFQKLIQFSEKCGAEIPRWLMMQLRSREHDPDQLRAYGADVVANLCRRLMADGASGIHVYTLNLARPTQAFLALLLDS